MFELIILLIIIEYILYRIYKRYFSNSYEAYYRVHEKEIGDALSVCSDRLLKRDVLLHLILMALSINILKDGKMGIFMMNLMKRLLK